MSHPLVFDIGRGITAFPFFADLWCVYFGICLRYVISGCYFNSQ